MGLDTEIIQTIEGDTLDECKRKLYEMYGDDWEIKDRQSVFKHCGLFGLRQKNVQIVSYIVRHKKAYDKNTYTNYSREAEQEQLEKNKQAILQNNSNVIVTAALNNITSKIEQMGKQIDSMNTSITSASSDVHETIKKIDELLEQNEFTPSYIRMMEEKIKSQFSLVDLDDFKLVERNVVDWIGDNISISPERVFRPPHVVVIIGPTGVGKTTTLAKLVASTILDAKTKNIPKPKICIFTIDSMRVGAMEQLTILGDYMNQKVLKAETPEDVKQIYEENKEHVDYIFVDTGGYSPNDAEHIGMMKTILDAKMNPDVYLCVAASTKASDLNNIFKNYEPLDYNSVIITKCDETKVLGNVLSVLWDKRKPVAYITDGQVISRNLHKANVIDLLKNLNEFDIDRVHLENKFGEQ